MKQKDRVVELGKDVGKKLKLFINESQTAPDKKACIEFLDPIKDKEILKD